MFLERVEMKLWMEGGANLQSAARRSLPSCRSMSHGWKPLTSGPMPSSTELFDQLEQNTFRVKNSQGIHGPSFDLEVCT